jgi:RNA polymerase sigma factor (sigma-70 family)
MADKEKYIIEVEGKLVEVSEDVYYAYFRMERQERWQEEKKQEHGVVSYDALDTEETVGAEAIQDMTATSMEERAVAKELNERLHHAVAALPKAERELIRAVYFEGQTEREYAEMAGLSQTGVSYRRRKILSKLKLFLDFMGSFC